MFPSSKYARIYSRNLDTGIVQIENEYQDGVWVQRYRILFSDYIGGKRTMTLNGEQFEKFTDLRIKMAEKAEKLAMIDPTLGDYIKSEINPDKLFEQAKRDLDTWTSVIDAMVKDYIKRSCDELLAEREVCLEFLRRHDSSPDLD